MAASLDHGDHMREIEYLDDCSSKLYPRHGASPRRATFPSHFLPLSGQRALP
jgi:hypothetical protein